MGERNDNEEEEQIDKGDENEDKIEDKTGKMLKEKVIIHSNARKRIR